MLTVGWSGRTLKTVKASADEPSRVVAMTPVVNSAPMFVAFDKRGWHAK
jgi:hypothetical protein